MALVVGLDIGSKTITGAVISGTSKRFRLVDFFVEEVPDLDLDLATGGALSTETVDLDSEGDLPIGVAEVVRRVLAERNLENADVVASLPAKNCILREFWVPFVREDQIRKTLPFEAENSLITFDVDDMVLEYHKVGESEGKSQLVLFAARSQAVRDRLGLLGDAGVDPVALDLDAAALFNAYALTPTFDAQRTTLLIDMGASTTNVLLIQDGALRKVRAIRMDGFSGHLGHRQLPQGDGGEPSGGSSEGRLGFEFPDASSIEARFDEIENTLRRIDPHGVGPLDLGEPFDDTPGRESEESHAPAATGDDSDRSATADAFGTGESFETEEDNARTAEEEEHARPARAHGANGADDRGTVDFPTSPASYAGGGAHGAMAGEQEEEEEPIAILTDEEYERVSAEAEAEAEASAGEASPGDDATDEELLAASLARERAPVVETAEEHFARAQKGAGGELPDVPAGPGGGAADPHGDPQRSFRHYLERLGLEIQRTFATNFIRSPVELVCLTGGMSHHEEARRFFRSELDIETIALDFGDSFETDIEDEQRESLNRLGAVAVGLAVKEQGHDHIGFDFRKGEFRYERRFDKLKYPLLLTGVMLCALFLQLVFDLISQYQFWQQRSYGIRAREQEYFDAFWGDLGTQVRSQDLLTPASLRLKERLEQRLGKGGGDIPILIDDIDALVEVGDVFRKAKERNMRFKITQIDLSLATRTAPGRGKGRAPQLQAPGSSSVQVDVESPMDVQELRKIFEETATMWDVSPSHTSTQGQVKATFKLTPKEAFLRKLSS